MLLLTFLLAACASKPQAPTSSESADASSTVQKNLDEETYNALNVPEKDGRKRDKKGRPTIGAAITEKSVGGVTCQKISVVYPGAEPKFNCATTNKVDAKKVYPVLKAEEKKEATAETSVTEKTVGGLSCQKISSGKGTKPKYECTSRF